VSLFLPDQNDEHLGNRDFYQYLFVSVQEPWMQKYNPGFKMDKTIKLVLHHPAGTDTTPAALIEEYSELLKKLEAAAKKESAEC
jgi:transcription-repair coupling factor (superfamily II helicase)